MTARSGPRFSRLKSKKAFDTRDYAFQKKLSSAMQPIVTHNLRYYNGGSSLEQGLEAVFKIKQLSAKLCRTTFSGGRTSNCCELTPTR